MSGGRASVRRALFMGVPVARRHNPVPAFFERLISSRQMRHDKAREICEVGPARSYRRRSSTKGRNNA